MRIRDFKSIRDVQVHFDPVTILVGRSGTGKSNIIQSVRFLRNLLIAPEPAVANEYGWSRIAPVTAQAAKPSFEITFSLPAEQDQYTYILEFGVLPQVTAQGNYHPNHIKLQTEVLTYGDEKLYGRTRNNHGHWQWVALPKVQPVPNFTDYPMLGAFPSVLRIVYAHAALSTGIGYYHFPSTTLTSIPTPVPVPELISKVPGLSDVASNYREIMRAITQDFHHPEVRKNILASLRKINPSIESVELDSLQNPTTAIIGHKTGDKLFGLNLEQESDGLRRFYAHLLALYQRPPKLCVIFEEPENAIFPGALSLLADEMKAAPKEGRGQVIITTHNPMFLDRFEVDNVRAVEMESGNTVVGPVSTEQKKAVHDRLMTTGDLLTVDHARPEGLEARAGSRG